MNDQFREERIEVDGFQFEVRYFYDQDSGPPWEECDGHGPVRVLGRSNHKRPGERPMCSGRDTYLYDWQAAAKLARKDGWNTEPYDAPKRVERAVQADFEYLLAYVREKWHYCGVEVKMVLHPQYNDALWRVETYKDYHLESAKEQARELLHLYLDDIESGKLRKEE